jgi:hypothetical protein
MEPDKLTDELVFEEMKEAFPNSTVKITDDEGNFVGFQAVEEEEEE